MSARQRFLDTFGTEPDGLWSAPGRVNLIGEHTDYNDGFVLPFAIDRATIAAVALRDDRRIRITSTFAPEVVETSLDDLDHARLDGWSAYPLGVVWALGDIAHAPLDEVRGFDLALDSTVPVGAGLSSSAAIEMSVAVALDELWALGLDRPTLARVGQRAENVAVGAPTGIMDQSASVFGAQDAAVFLDCRTLATETVPLGFAAAGLVLLVVDSKVEHAHANGGYRARRESCERGAVALDVPALRDVSTDDLPRAAELLDEETYRRVRHIVTENARVLESVDALREGRLESFGRLMDASHVSMRDDFEISVPELDLIVETAQAHGSVGARMTGGGFGGSAIALIASDAVDGLLAAIAAAFEERGCRAPEAFTVTAADGAGRVG